jgi:antitoxin component of RelBE/YafQ-DinJ toxin-antitoxin module
MITKTVSATVPADLKAEATAVLAARGISMTALVRELLARVDAIHRIGNLSSHSTPPAGAIVGP